MTAKGHLLFSISCAVFAKNINLTSIFVQGDWWHVIPSAILTCLLPDIDHPKSFLGKRMKWISKPITMIFGHRSFTHSFLAIFLLFLFFQLRFPKIWIVPEDVIHGMMLGYVSHILGDMLTPAGVPLFWPCRWRFRFPILIFEKDNQLEKIFRIAIFFYIIWILKNMVEKYAAYYFSQISNLLEIQLHCFINY